MTKHNLLKLTQSTAVCLYRRMRQLSSLFQGHSHEDQTTSIPHESEASWIRDFAKEEKYTSDCLLLALHWDLSRTQTANYASIINNSFVNYCSIKDTGD